jgi:GNAT superfamily N-acetyltransferase
MADVTPERGLPAGLVLGRAEEGDAAALAALQTAAASDLTERYGRGHWSYETSERAVLRSIATARVLVARIGGEIAGALTLQPKKPWAIDRAYFTDVSRALYLIDMAVQPDLQRRGIGRRLLQYAAEVARDWPAGAIRLDAYDAEAGAGGFYARCGYRECGRVTYRGTPLIYYELLLSAGPSAVQGSTNG